MPKIHLPDGRIVHFPEGMSSVQIESEVAKLGGTSATPPSSQERTWTAKALDALPTIGGTAGGILGGIGGSAFGLGVGGVPGAMGGAAVGGAGGEGLRQSINAWRGKGALLTPGPAIGRMATQGAVHAAGAGTGLGLAKVPAGRLLTSGLAMVPKLPLVRSFAPAARAAAKAWKASAARVPAAVATAADPDATVRMLATAADPDATVRMLASEATDATVRMVKPKLSAAEAAAYLRKVHGSARAGRMLFGPARPGLKAAERQAAIKQLAPVTKSELPTAAARAIDKELAASTADEAFAYAMKAPNDRAKEYMGEQLRQALLARMTRPK